MVQQVKDPALSLQQLGSLLWQVQSQAWELPYASGMAKKRKERQGSHLLAGVPGRVIQPLNLSVLIWEMGASSHPSPRVVEGMRRDKVREPPAGTRLEYLLLRLILLSLWLKAQPCARLRVKWDRPESG